MASIKKSNFIKLSKSSIGRAEKNAVLEVLDLEYLGMGERLRSLSGHLVNIFSAKSYVYQVALQRCSLH